MSGYVDNGTAPWGGQLAQRHALFGFSNHALFTGLFGLGLGLARQTTRVWLRYTVPIVGWLMGFSGHLLNNGLQLLLLLLGILTAQQADAAMAEAKKLADPPFLQALIYFTGQRLMLFFPFVLVTVVMLWQSGIWERQVIREELADESKSVITPEEYEAIKGDRIFRTRRIQDTDRRISAALVQAQNELAFRKWRVKQMGNSPDTDALVTSLRDEVVRL